MATADTTMPSMKASMTPTVDASMAPTVEASMAPTVAWKTATVEGVTMDMVGVTGVLTEDEATFNAITSLFSVGFFANQPLLGVEELETTVTITGQEAQTRRHLLRGGNDSLRNLQTVTTVTYTQTFEYRATNPNVTPYFLASTPFANEQARDVYTGLLVEQGGSFETLTGVFPVELPETPSPTEAPTLETEAPTVQETSAPSSELTPGPTQSDDDGLSTGAIIGIAVGGGVFLILLLLGCFFGFGGNSGDYPADNDPPDSVKVKPQGDEVSTLAAPQVQGGAANESLAGYEDPRYV